MASKRRIPRRHGACAIRRGVDMPQQTQASARRRVCVANLALLGDGRRLRRVGSLPPSLGPADRAIALAGERMAQELSLGPTALRDFVIVPRLRLRPQVALVRRLRNESSTTALPRAVSAVGGLVWVGTASSRGRKAVIEAAGPPGPNPRSAVPRIAAAWVGADGRAERRLSLAFREYDSRWRPAGLAANPPASTKKPLQTDCGHSGLSGRFRRSPKATEGISARSRIFFTPVQALGMIQIAVTLW